MRILAIGGNGFIGMPLVRELREAGHNVALLDRSAAAPSSEGVALIRGDRNRLQDYEVELRRFAPAAIIDMMLSSGKQAEQLVDLADWSRCRSPRIPRCARPPDVSTCISREDEEHFQIGDGGL